MLSHTDTNNLESCSIQPTLDLVFFECNCIHNYRGCCNLRAIIHDNVVLDEMCTDGVELSYLQLPTGDYSIECYNGNTLKVVNKTNVTLRRRNMSCAMLSVCVTPFVLPSSSVATVLPSIDRKMYFIMGETESLLSWCHCWNMSLYFTDVSQIDKNTYSMCCIWVYSVQITSISLYYMCYNYYVWHNF